MICKRRGKVRKTLKGESLQKGEWRNSRTTVAMNLVRESWWGEKKEIAMKMKDEVVCIMCGTRGRVAWFFGS